MQEAISGGGCPFPPQWGLVFLQERFPHDSDGAETNCIVAPACSCRYRCPVVAVVATGVDCRRDGASLQRQTAVRCFKQFNRIILGLPCGPPSRSWVDRRSGPVRSRPFWSWLLQTIAQQRDVEKKAKVGAFVPSWHRRPITRPKVQR